MNAPFIISSESPTGPAMARAVDSKSCDMAVAAPVGRMVIVAVRTTLSNGSTKAPLGTS